MYKPKRIFDIFKVYKNSPDTIGGFNLYEKINKEWVGYNTEEYERVSNELSSGFLELGIKKGDKIATITNNRPQWNFLDMGILQAGAVHVTIYPTISIDEFNYILKHSDTKYVFVANRSLYKKIKPLADKINKIKGIYTIDDIEGVPNWKKVALLGQNKLDKNIKKIEKIKKEIKEDDLATIIYTSGTTGSPKGVMLSHKNILSNSIASVNILNINYTHKVLSFLPLSHVFAHMTNYMYQISGIDIYYVDNIARVADYMNELQVDGFITVPRFLEAIFEKITMRAKKLSSVRRKMFEYSLKIAEQYEPYQKMSPGYRAKYNLMNKLVFSQWRKALSPNIKFLGCGGSALSPRLARIFWAAGFRVFEGYGLTETSPVIAVNRHDYPDLKIGTVGPTMENIEVKIAEDGEILVKGPSVMIGYYKDPEATKEVIDSDNWFHTGDVGILHERNILQITDRKKSMFKLSSGKYILPQVIENKIKESPFIGQVMIVGEHEKFASAIICPSFEHLHSWAALHNIKFTTNMQLVNNEVVVARIKKEITRLNQQLGAHERVKKFELLAKEWTTESGELSPTLKLRRNFIMKKYKDKIQSIYNKKNT